MAHYVPPHNTIILKKRHIDLFPKRRQSDQRKPFSGSYLTTFTDLMALLLTFFIMIYATRDPAPVRLIVIDPPAIAAPVKPTPPNVSDKPSFKQTEAGLELNYLAGLLSQAATRDGALAKAQINTNPYALHIEFPITALDTANAVLSRVQGSNRSILVAGSQAFLDGLWGQYGSDITYVSRDDNKAHILVH